MTLDIPTLTDQIMQQESDHVVQSYKRAPFVLVHGEGVHLYDSEGKAYMDWVAGIAVNSLGYKDEGVQKVINQQLGTGLIHVSNLYHTVPQADLATMLCEKSFADRVFFCNSGTEANEAALKFARKVAYEQGKTEKHEIITFTNGFHGRTMGSLAMTPRDKYQKPFAPMLPGVHVAEFNDLDSVKALINENTAAVIIEPIQGEGGVNVADIEFMQGLRDLCNQYDALLIFDEVQCGVGRSGTLWGHEPYGVTPDIMTLAKPLAAGLPIGAVLVTEAVGSAIKPGDHGSTFAGGPVVTAVAKEVLTRISDPEFLAHVREVGDYLTESLNELQSPLIKEVRGRGLMAAVELTVETAPIIEAGYENGLILVNAGANVLRFVPPLIVDKSHVDTLVERLSAILTQVQS
ncbi:MAG: aspartate aminotransferase family protein [Aggregatilineales bacterium]